MATVIFTYESWDYQTYEIVAELSDSQCVLSCSELLDDCKQTKLIESIADELPDLEVIFA